MRTSKAGIELIKSLEGLKLVAYRCSAGVPTIGYGHTKGVKMGDTCTAEQAEKWLREDLSISEDAVNNLGLEQHEFDAVVSLVFNIGISAFRGSTIRKLIVAKAAKKDIAAQFAEWKFAGGKANKGLINRRAKEAALFLS